MGCRSIVSKMVALASVATDSPIKRLMLSWAKATAATINSTPINAEAAPSHLPFPVAG
jgi:hypothetical protein